MLNICNVVLALLVNMSMIYSADFIALSGTYNFDINKTAELYMKLSHDRSRDVKLNGYLKKIVSNGGIRYAITDKTITITRDNKNVEWIIVQASDKNDEIFINLKNKNGENKIMKMILDENKINVNSMNDIFVLIKL